MAVNPYMMIAGAGALQGLLSGGGGDVFGTIKKVKKYWKGLPQQMEQQMQAAMAAGTQEEADRQRMIDEYEQRLEMYRAEREELAAAGAPLRELAGEATGLLREDIMREPGTGPLYERALEKGARDIAITRSKYGLLKGGGTDVAFGGLTGRLLAEDIGRISGARERAARYGMTGLMSPLTPPGGSRYLPRGETDLSKYQITPPGTSGPRGRPTGDKLAGLLDLPFQYYMAKEMFPGAGKTPNTDTPDYYGRQW
jgi:hypothetical protein